MKSPRQLKELYEKRQNISAFLRDQSGSKQNTREIIEIAYDLQTGSYISAMKNKEFAKHKEDYTKELVNIILSLCDPASILEAGVGEATTLSGVLSQLGREIASYGFDLSWSRAAYAKFWLHDNGIHDSILCTGDLFNIPFADNSIDVVYTSHSIEPNGGSEEPILRELYRVARKYVLLLEPGYELANDEARQRMESHGYCKGLERTARSLGYDVLDHRLFPYSATQLNPTALTVIRKVEEAEAVPHALVCPKWKAPLQEVNGMLFSPEALSVYPVVGGIPCLRIENAIVASKYRDVMAASSPILR